MAYKQVSREELEQYLASNPGAKYRVNGQEYQNAFGDEDQGALMKILTNITKPIRTVPGGLWSAITGSAKENPFLTEREEQQYAADPTEFGTKSAIALGSSLIGGGAAPGLTGAKAIGSAALRGAAGGAVGGLGYSEEGEELKSMLSGGALGGLIGGALQGVGEGVRAIKSAKVSNKLADMSDDLKTTAYKKKIGVAPTAKQGKYDLVRDSMELANTEGRKITGAEDLFQFSDEVLGKYGNTASDMARLVDDAGTTVPVEKLIKPLQEKMKALKFPEDKAAYQEVINQIKAATGNAKNIPTSELLILRRQIGPKGNWNQLTPTAEQTMAKIWEGVYNTANQTLDDTLSQAGMTGFREINKKLATAIEQQNWARRAMASKAGQQVWTDMTQDAAIIGNILGGGPGSAAAAIGSKILQGQGENIAAKGLDVASKVAAGTSGLPKVLEPILQAGQRMVPAISGLAQQGALQGTPQESIQQGGTQFPTPQQEPTQGISAVNMMLAEGILSGQISASEAEAVLSLLGIGGASGQQKLTESQRDYQLASEALKNAYDIVSSEGGAGKLATLGGNIAGFLGSTTASSEYRAALDTATAFLRKALIGSGQSEAELKNLNLPKPTDEPAIAKQKIESLIPLLQGRAGLQPN